MQKPQWHRSPLAIFFHCHMCPCPARSLVLPQPMWHPPFLLCSRRSRNDIKQPHGSVRTEKLPPAEFSMLPVAACCACWASPTLKIKPKSEAHVPRAMQSACAVTAPVRVHRGRRWGAAVTPVPRLCIRPPDDAVCAAAGVRATVPGPVGHGERALRAKPCLSA